MRSASPTEVIENVRKWAEERDDIRALALIGSHARGSARPDSDIDLVLVCSDPARYVRRTDWVSGFGPPRRVTCEDWGRVQSVRVFYETGEEIEFAIAGIDWAEVPLDPGTVGVLKNGCSILIDRDGSLARALHALS